MNTTDEIYNELKSAFENEAGIAMNDGGDMALRFRALAAQLVSLQAQAEFVQRQCFPQTATGEALDTHALQRGLYRIAAQKATGILRFSLNSAAASDITISGGTRCISPDEKVFTVTEDAVISAGSTFCSANAEADEAGAGGNVAANSVIFMELPPVGVAAVTNPNAFTGGSDAESDEELRRRVLDSFRSIRNSGNAAYYRDMAMAVSGVAAAEVQPRYRGRGTVDVIVATETGVPSQTVLGRVSSALNGRREICVDVDVKAPTPITVNVDAEITVGSGFDSDTVLENVENAVREHFTGRILGKGLSRAELGNLIYSVEGVENYSLSLPQADLEANLEELPVLGTVSISEV